MTNRHFASVGKPLRVLIQKDDFKTRQWAEAARSLGVRAFVASRSPLLMPVEIIRLLVCSGRPDAVVFRYLNDYPSLVKSYFRLSSEVISILLCFMLRSKIIWICHNVDRETERNHPRLSLVRRLMFAQVADTIFVLDPLLVVPAQSVFSWVNHKIDYLSFGELSEPRKMDAEQLLDDLRLFVSRARSTGVPGSRVLLGLCIGSPAEKVVHFDSIPQLIPKADSLGYSLYFIVIGPVRDFLRRRDPQLLDFLETSDRVFFVGERVVIDEAKVAKLADFYWRAYSDLSVPLSLYGACTARKPVLTLNTGFMGEAVRHYRLGAVIDLDFSNLAEAISAIPTWEPVQADAFLREHTWAFSSFKLFSKCC